MRLLAEFRPVAPALGLAIEETILESARDDGTETVRLWVNERAVIVGRSQAVAAEVCEEQAVELGIPILRRLSGGGTVYHYPGNLNLTAAFRKRSARSDVASVFAFFGHVMARGLAPLVPGLVVDGNGLYIDDLKVGGAAQAHRGSVVLYHTTLMVMPPAIAVERLLRAMVPGYRADGVASRPRPMTSLSNRIGRNVHPAGIAQPLVDALSDALDVRLAAGTLTAAETTRAQLLATAKYGSAQWNRSR